MGKFFFWQIFLLGMLASVFGGERGSYSSYFAIEGDYVLMRRANSQNTKLVVATNDPNFIPIIPIPPPPLPLLPAQPKDCIKPKGTPFIQSKNLIHDMNFDSGFSAALKIFPSIYSTLEGRYLGGFSWKGHKEMKCPQNLSIGGQIAMDTIDYDGASKAKTRYLSKMYTYEVNYWRHMTPRYIDHFSVSWLVGIRFFKIDEAIRMRFTKELEDISQTSHYKTKTDNFSGGIQLGGDLEYNPYSFLTWGVVVKVGALYNHAKNRTHMRDQNNTVVIRDIDRCGSNFAYTAQVFPFIQLRPSKQCFITFDYQVLYVGAVATAERNVVLHGSGSVLRHNGHIIYHGATGALQINF